LNKEIDNLNDVINEANFEIHELRLKLENDREQMCERMLERDNSDAEKVQQAKYKVIQRVVSAKKRLMAMGWRQSKMFMKDDAEYEQKMINKLRGCIFRMTDKNYALMSGGFTVLKDNYDIVRQKMKGKLQFVIKTLIDKDSLSKFKAYNNLKERKLIFDGVGFGDAAMKKIQLLKR